MTSEFYEGLRIARKIYSFREVGIFAYLIEAEWRTYASLHYAFVGLDNGLSSVRRRVIVEINIGLLWIGPFWIYFSVTSIEIQQFS